MLKPNQEFTGGVTRKYTIDSGSREIPSSRISDRVVERHAFQRRRDQIAEIRLLILLKELKSEQVLWKFSISRKFTVIFVQYSLKVLHYDNVVSAN